MVRAFTESIPPIRRIRNREFAHLRQFIASLRRGLPDCDDAHVYWGLHFTLAMVQDTICERERLASLSDGKCDINDVHAIIDRIVSVAAIAFANTGQSHDAR